MVMCYAPDCKHYSEREQCKFFVFPKDAKEKKVWSKLLRREDREPSKNSLVCSCHFLNGDRNNRPTIFEHNKEKRLEKISPEQKKRRNKSPLKKLTAVEMPSTSELAPADSVSSSSCSNAAASLSKLDITNQHFVSMVEAENYLLKEQVSQLETKLNHLSVTFGWEHIQNDDKRVLMYTGLPNKDIFNSLYSLMENFSLNYYYGWSVIGVSKKNQLLLTLMKLRLNLQHEDLACRFNVSRTTVSNVVYTWIHALHEVVFVQLMEKIPTRQKNKLCAPSSFDSFGNCRIIIDCTELTATTPKSMEKQQLTYSAYKHSNTLKGLIGVAPNGVCTYVSELYPGSTSDKKLFHHCGLGESLEPGDLVVADKGFLIGDMLPDGVNLNIPPFLTTPQFTDEQVAETQKIARARVHVERAIRRIKCFDILNKIPASLIPESSYIFQVCGALTNFQYPLIKEVEDLFCTSEF